MQLNDLDFKKPCFIFEKNIDGEDASKILAIFKEWVNDELQKRIIKKGKLFEFYITNSDNHYSLRYGNKNNVVDVSSGFMIENPIVDSNAKKVYKFITDEVILFINDFVKENNLSLEIKPTSGISKIYQISR